MAKMSKERRQEIRDLKEVMSTAAGRRFVWRQIAVAGVFQPCYNPEQEGGRRIGLALLGEVVNECPADYLKMQGEHMAEETRKKVDKQTKKKGEDEDERPNDE